MEAVLKKTRIADADLVMLIRTHKKEAAELLYNTYAKFLLLAIIRVVPEKEMAMHVLEATFKKIWSTIDDYVLENEKIYTWMITIAKKLASETLTANLMHENKIQNL